MDALPFVHLFTTSQGKYLYDVNMDQILRIPDLFYKELKDKLAGRASITQTESYYKKLQSFGFLKTNRVNVVKHPATDILPSLINRKLSQMVLQITQQCNLRCEYCIYSGDYNTRTHSQNNMEWSIAEKAMDYFIAHSADNESITLSFYGGEPLLRFDFIRKCVEYMENNLEGKEIHYNFTTNGTIMTPEIAEFCVEKNFGIMFSLDGPREMHDQHRKFQKSGEGSFNFLEKTIQYFEDNYPEYSRTFQFNTVIDTSRNYKSISEFMNTDDRFHKYSFLINTIDEAYTSKRRDISESYLQESEYEYFEYLLSKTGRLPASFVSKFAAQRYRDVPEKVIRNRDKKGIISNENHHGGPCIPGVRKLFVTTSGDFFPCERVSETSILTKLGDVFSGIDLKKAEDILNIERKTHEICRECWAYRYCTSCVKALDGITDYDLDALKRKCESVRSSTDSIFKDYCVLREVGFDFFDDKCGEIKWKDDMGEVSNNLSI